MPLEILNNHEAACSQSHQYTFNLVWTPSKHYIPGTEVEIRVRDKHCFLHWTWLRFDAQRLDITWREPDDWRGIKWDNLDQVILRATVHYEVWEKHRIPITITAHTSGTAGVNPILEIWIKDTTSNPDEIFEFEPEPGSEVQLFAVPGPVQNLYLIARPAPEADGSVRAALVPEDRMCNPASFQSPVYVTVMWDGREIQQSVQGTTTFLLPKPQGDANIMRPSAKLAAMALAEDEVLKNATLTDGVLQIVGSPVWLQPEDGLMPTFGAIHWHSEFSGDGTRKMTDGILAARDTLNLDFVSSADHHPTAEDWASTVEALQHYYAPGTFVTLFGWEAASDRGHCNFYFIDPDHHLRPHGETNLVDEAMKLRKGGDVNHNARPEDYLYKLEGDDFLVIPHHTNADGRYYWRAFPWGEPTPLVRMVEIMQGRGNMEIDQASDRWQSRYQDNGGSIRDALAKGFRFGFNGGTDNHCGWPGRLNRPSYASAHPHNIIVTGAWVDDRMRESVFDALYQRHTWVTWGTRAIVDFRINAMMSGSDLTVESGEILTATIRISAEDALWSVELISEGETVWQERFTDMDVDVTVDLGSATKNTFFYLRAQQRDGAIIYASPVFVDVLQ